MNTIQKRKNPTLSRAKVDFRIESSDGYTSTCTNDSKVGSKCPNAVLLGGIEELVRAAALYGDGDGHDIINMVTDTVNRVKTFKENQK